MLTTPEYLPEELSMIRQKHFPHWVAILLLVPLLLAAEPKKESLLVGEKVLPADDALKSAPLRPIKGTALFKLTNLRVGGTMLTVHYEQVAGELQGRGPVLVIRGSDGREFTTIGRFRKAKDGDFTVDGRMIRGGLPKNMEVYLMWADRRWEGEDFEPKFKVSNSVVSGEMGKPIQFAREWNEEEAKKINDPPPEAPVANTNKNVGTDTKFVGHTMGLLPAGRTADPKGRPVIGVLYTNAVKQFEKGEKFDCLINFGPAYHERQPRYGQTAVFAKEGYAVGGLNVKTRKVVTGVQVVFMKLKPNGTLDPADKYTSDWLGEPGEGDKQASLTGKGRKVIGMHIKNFGNVFAIALVLK